MIFKQKKKITELQQKNAQLKRMLEAYEQTTLAEIGQGFYTISIPEAEEEQLTRFKKAWEEYSKDKPLLQQTKILLTNKKLQAKKTNEEEKI